MRGRECVTSCVVKSEMVVCSLVAAGWLHGDESGRSAGAESAPERRQEKACDTRLTCWLSCEQCCQLCVLN